MSYSVKSVEDEVRELFRVDQFSGNENLLHRIAFQIHSIVSVLVILRTRSELTRLQKIMRKNEPDASLFKFEKRTRKDRNDKYVVVLKSSKTELSKILSPYQALENGVSGLIQLLNGVEVTKEYHYPKIFEQLWQPKKVLQGFDLINSRLESDKIEVRNSAFADAFKFARKQAFLEKDVKETAVYKAYKKSFIWDDSAKNQMRNSLIRIVDKNLLPSKLIDPVAGNFELFEISNSEAK